MTRGAYLGNKYGIRDLSKREEPVAILIRDERLSNEEIAERIGMTKGYVKQLVDGIYNKLIIGSDITRAQLPDVLQAKMKPVQKKTEEPVVETISVRQFVSEVFPGLID